MTAALWARWREERDAAARRPFGPASLSATVHLDDQWRQADTVPGSWRLNGDLIIGRVDGAQLTIAPGEEIETAGVRLRSFARGGTHVLRVFDPASPHRAGLAGIDAFPYDPDWVVTGAFRPARGDTHVDVAAVDGLVSRARLAGTITLPTPVGVTELTVTHGSAGGLSAVLGDSTNGTETYRFRFLEVGAVDGGTITVDFNRAYLPPCAFSPEYVCPLPLPGNRWTVPVRAGERNVRRTRESSRV